MSKFIEPIQPWNDAWMVIHANRPPKLVPISFEKTAEERKQLKKVHKSKSGPHSDGTIKFDHSIPRRLTVHVANLVTHNKNKFKTTYSAMCQFKEIDSILQAFYIKKEHIVKMYWNGKPVSI